MKLTDLAHELWLQCLNGGECVIDATAGNGNDTLFLAKNIGEKGKAFAFDIQQMAIDATKALLEQNKLLYRVQLIHDSHLYLRKYIPIPIHATVFNLGYLPDGNHDITTDAQTSLSAIKLAWDMISENGFLSVMTYPGHEQGLVEHEKLAPFLMDLINKNKGEHIAPQTIFRRPPELFFIRKTTT